ncbi:hypothetical protein ABZY42_23995 [Streptomyces sp. NPDC006622]|uniref:hypothetical protein n=1 Tax=Streptomyces sp. NPDC006622 TaxID=3155459 RepID=UPI0033B783FF
MDREQHVCPGCGQTVDTVVRRHKTLGAWVPRWVAGPCHNPDCTAYVEPGTEQHGHTDPTEHTGHTGQHGTEGPGHSERDGRAESPERADGSGAPTVPTAPAP